MFGSSHRLQLARSVSGVRGACGGLLEVGGGAAARRTWSCTLSEVGSALQFEMASSATLQLTLWLSLVLALLRAINANLAAFAPRRFRSLVLAVSVLAQV